MDEAFQNTLLRKIDALSKRVDELDAGTQRAFGDVHRQLRKAEKRALIQVPDPNFKVDLPRRVSRIQSLLQVSSARDIGKARVGAACDGGYVCLDDFGRYADALSLGIDHEVSWDLDIAERGIVVHQFDHTVEGPPQDHPNFRFHAARIAPDAGEGRESLASILAALPDDREAPCLVKMDIEGDEWDVFDTVPDACLERIGQLVCELHGFHTIHSDAKFARIERVLAKLARHFAPVHVHANNNAPIIVLGNVPFYQTLEVTYVSRKMYVLEASKEHFPIALDAPNNPDFPDHYIGRFFSCIDPSPVDGEASPPD